MVSFKSQEISRGWSLLCHCHVRDIICPYPISIWREREKERKRKREREKERKREREKERETKRDEWRESLCEEKNNLSLSRVRDELARIRSQSGESEREREREEWKENEFCLM